MSKIRALTTGIMFDAPPGWGADVGALVVNRSRFLATWVGQFLGDGMLAMLIDRAGNVIRQTSVPALITTGSANLASGPLLVNQSLAVQPAIPNSGTDNTVQLAGINLDDGTLAYNVTVDGLQNPVTNGAWCQNGTIYIPDVHGVTYTYDGTTGESTGTIGPTDGSTGDLVWIVRDLNDEPYSGPYAQQVVDITSFSDAITPAFAMCFQDGYTYQHIGAGVAAGGYVIGDGLGAIHRSGSIGLLAANAYPINGDSHGGAVIVSFGTPPLRWRQRSDGLGAGAPRTRQVSTIQASLRTRGIV